MKDRRRRLLGAVLSAGVAVCVAASGAGSYAWASPASRAEKERQEASRRKEEAESLARELEKQRDGIAGETQELDRELKELLQETDILERDMEDMEKRIGTARQEYEKADESRQRQYGILKDRIRYIYEEGNISYLDMLLKARNMGDMIRQTEYFSQLYEYDRKLIDTYEDLRRKALDKKEELEEHRAELEGMSREYGLRRDRLVTVIEGRKKEAKDFELQLAAAKKEAGEAAKTVRIKTEEIRALKEKSKMPSGDGSQGGLENREIKTAGGSGLGRSAADYALQFVGNPYVWGGTSLTDGADCSGFTQSVYRHFGISIPRTSGEQAHFGKEIAYGDMEPGDLVCYVGHVAMYIGGGRIVHASSQKSGIKVGDDPAYRTIVSIRRPW